MFTPSILYGKININVKYAISQLDFSLFLHEEGKKQIYVFRICHLTDFRLRLMPTLMILSKVFLLKSWNHNTNRNSMPENHLLYA